MPSLFSLRNKNTQSNNDLKFPKFDKSIFFLWKGFLWLQVLFDCNWFSLFLISKYYCLLCISIISILFLFLRKRRITTTLLYRYFSWISRFFFQISSYNWLNNCLIKLWNVNLKIVLSKHLDFFPENHFEKLTNLDDFFKLL